MKGRIFHYPCIDCLVPFPGRRIRQGNDRFQGFTGILWKQYSHREIFGFFPVTSNRFLTERAGRGQKSLEKSRHFLLGILLPSYDDFRQETLFFLTVPTRNGVLRADSCGKNTDPYAGITVLGCCSDPTLNISYVDNHNNCPYLLVLVLIVY